MNSFERVRVPLSCVRTSQRCKQSQQQQVMACTKQKETNGVKQPFDFWNVREVHSGIVYLKIVRVDFWTVRSAVFHLKTVRGDFWNVHSGT